MQEVIGSIPFTSTKLSSSAEQGNCLRSPSSRGLGHHPFTVSTGVRIPLGTPALGSRKEDGLRRPSFFLCLCLWSGGVDPLYRVVPIRPDIPATYVQARRVRFQKKQIEDHPNIRNMAAAEFVFLHSIEKGRNFL